MQWQSKLRMQYQGAATLVLHVSGLRCCNLFWPGAAVPEPLRLPVRGSAGSSIATPGLIRSSRTATSTRCDCGCLGCVVRLTYDRGGSYSGNGLEAAACGFYNLFCEHCFTLVEARTSVSLRPRGLSRPWFTCWVYHVLCSVRLVYIATVPALPGKREAKPTWSKP